MLKLFKYLAGCGTLLVVGFIALGVVASKVAAPSPEEEAAARAALSDHYTQIAAIHQALTAEDLDRDAIPCDREAMTAAAGAEPGATIRLPRLYLPYLSRFAGDYPQAWDGDLGGWEFLVEDDVWDDYAPVDQLSGIQVKSLTKYTMPELVGTRYVAVFNPASLELNRLPELQDGGFKGGIFLGLLHVVDTTDASVVCQGALGVANSDEVQFIGGADKALRKDFMANFEAKIAEILPEKVEVVF